MGLRPGESAVGFRAAKIDLWPLLAESPGRPEPLSGRCLEWSDRETCLAAGMSDYLAKLAEAIERWALTNASPARRPR